MRLVSKAFPDRVVIVRLLVALTLAGCQAPALHTVPIAVPGALPSPSAETASPSSAPADPMPANADLVADPSRFRGLTAPQVMGLLGAPSFQRREAEAEIWQYYGPLSACVLDLFLYPEQGTQRVAHAELRRRGGAAGACLAQIIDGKRG